MPSKTLKYEDKLAMITDYYSKFPKDVQRECYEEVPDNMTIKQTVDFLYDKMLVKQRRLNGLENNG